MATEPDEHTGGSASGGGSIPMRIIQWEEVWEGFNPESAHIYIDGCKAQISAQIIVSELEAGGLPEIILVDANNTKELMFFNISEIEGHLTTDPMEAGLVGMLATESPAMMAKFGLMALAKFITEELNSESGLFPS